MRTHKNIIVTLCYKRPDLTNRFLSGLVDNETGNIDKVIVVDNGSMDMKTDVMLDSWFSYLGFEVEIRKLSQNTGFTLGANHGLQRACKYAEERDLIFLISNDVEINGPFIKQAEEYLLRPDPILLGNRHINFDSGWNTFIGKTFDYLEGFFLASTKLGWQELGFFDHAYAPCDFEDVDLTTKAKYLGYNIVSLNNPNIVHAGAGTYGYNPEREAITKRNREYFKNKWVK